MNETPTAVGDGTKALSLRGREALEQREQIQGRTTGVFVEEAV